MPSEILVVDPGLIRLAAILHTEGISELLIVNGWVVAELSLQFNQGDDRQIDQIDLNVFVGRRRDLPQRTPAVGFAANSIAKAREPVRCEQDLPRIRCHCIRSCMATRREGRIGYLPRLKAQRLSARFENTAEHDQQQRCSQHLQDEFVITTCSLLADERPISI